MIRFAWMLVAIAGLTFAGCGGGDAPVTDAADAETENPVQNDLKEAGMEDISAEDYSSGGKSSNN